MPGDEYRNALNLAFRYLTSKSRSEKEVRDKLSYKGFSDMIVQSVVDRLKELNYLNDKEFTILWIRNRINFRPRGSNLVRYELLAKGIAAEMIEEIMLREFPFDKEIELCRQFTVVKWKQYARYPHDQAKRKLINFLKRKGFSWECIEEACK